MNRRVELLNGILAPGNSSRWANEQDHGWGRRSERKRNKPADE